MEIVIPPHVAGLEAVYAKLEALDQQHREEFDALANEVARCMASVPTKQGIYLPARSDIDLRRIEGEMVAAVVQIASTVFGPPGAPVSIPPEVWDPHCDDRRYGDLQRIPLPEIWRRIALHFQDGKAEGIAYAKVAETLVRKLRIKRGEAPKMIGGAFAFDTWAAWEDFFDQYSRGTTDSLRETLDALRAVALSAGMWNDDDDEQIAAAVQSLREMKGGCDGKRAVGGLIVLVPFKSKIQVRISAALGEQLQVFLSMHSPELAEQPV